MPDPVTPNDEGQPPETPPKADETPTPEGKAPKWEGEFDPERAARLVANLRDDLAKRDADLKAVREQLDAKDGADKSLQERLAALEERNAKAERDLLVAKVAKEAKVPDDLVEFLTAKDEAGLKAQAERLATVAKSTADDGSGRPRPALKSGAAEDDSTPEFDPKAVAEAYRRR